jgi:hypothetical protein
MDYIALKTLKNFQTARIAGYKAAQVATLPIAGNALQLYCIIYNHIFDGPSRDAIDNLFKTDFFFKPFYTKYEIIKVLCQEEKINPMDIINDNKYKIMIDPILKQLNLDTRITENFELFKNTINQNIVSILNYIKSKKDQITNIFTSLNIEKLKNATGGKTKRSRRKTKQSKRKNKTLGKK